MNLSFTLQGWTVCRVIVALIFTTAVIAGCSSGVGTGGTGGYTVAKSNLPHDLAPQVSDADFAAVATGATEFAIKVFPLLDSDPNNNTVYSPYSISQAFALLAPGASGATLSQIEQVMSFPLPQERFNPAFNSLNLDLETKGTGTVLPNGQQTPIIRNANALWGQKGFSILQTYLDTLAVNYGAGLNLVDFVNVTEHSRQTINTWVEGQTNNKIRDLIPPNGVTMDTRLVLTNAVWFKANWAFPFPLPNTAEGQFVNRDDTSSTVSIMRGVLVAPYAQVAGCRVVDIPYAGDNMSMLVIMPDPGTFDAFLASLTPALLADITSHLSTVTMALAMPKFAFSRGSSLAEILKSLGMTDVFNLGVADLSGIDGRADLFVSGVFHQAFIGVDEAGTEAAAATAITIGTTGTPTTLSVDHPFIFLIRDRQTGLILFMGKVVSL